MSQIICGWCGHAADPGKCGSCGRDPVLPWTQRGQDPRPASDVSGRPGLDADEIRRTYQVARAAVVGAGKSPTVEAIAEQLDRSPRTVRTWRQRFNLE